MNISWPGLRCDNYLERAAGDCPAFEDKFRAISQIPHPDNKRNEKQERRPRDSRTLTAFSEINQPCRQSASKTLKSNAVALKCGMAKFPQFHRGQISQRSSVVIARAAQPAASLLSRPVSHGILAGGWAVPGSLDGKRQEFLLKHPRSHASRCVR